MIDLVIGAAGATESFSLTGAVYVVFLNQDGTVKGTKRTGLEDILGDAAFGGARFGYSTESLGDVDGDGDGDGVSGRDPSA